MRFMEIDPMAGAFHHQVLARLAPLCASFLEVGVRDGDSALAVADVNRTIAMTLCDTWGSEHGGTGRGSEDHVRRRLADADYVGQVEFLTGRSQEKLPELSGRVFDLVHIDGDHSFDGALSDMKMAWPLTAKWMVVHDVFFGSVQSALFAWLDSVRVGKPGERSCPDIESMELSLSDHGSAVIRRLG